MLDAAHKRFHESIYEASGSKWLLQCIALLRDASDRYHRLFGPAQNMLRGGLEDHQHIVRWLAEGEPELASVLVRRHLERTGTTLRRLLVSQAAGVERASLEQNGRSPGRRPRLSGRPSTTRRRPESDGLVRALAPRDLAVLAQLAEGKSDFAIAAALEWPLVRVQRSLESVFRALDLKDNLGVDRRVTAALTYLGAASNLA